MIFQQHSSAPKFTIVQHVCGEQVVHSPPGTPESAIVPAATLYAGLSPTQPTMPSMWNDNGVLTYFDGTQNRRIDYNEGEVFDAFGNPTGIDI